MEVVTVSFVTSEELYELTLGHQIIIGKVSDKSKDGRRKVYTEKEHKSVDLGCRVLHNLDC